MSRKNCFSYRTWRKLLKESKENYHIRFEKAGPKASLNTQWSSHAFTTYKLPAAPFEQLLSWQNGVNRANERVSGKEKSVYTQRTFSSLPFTSYFKAVIILRTSCAPNWKHALMLQSNCPVESHFKNKVLPATRTWEVHCAQRDFKVTAHITASPSLSRTSHSATCNGI